MSRVDMLELHRERLMKRYPMFEVSGEHGEFAPMSATSPCRFISQQFSITKVGAVAEADGGRGGGGREAQEDWGADLV